MVGFRDHRNIKQSVYNGQASLNNEILRVLLEGLINYTTYPLRKNKIKTLTNVSRRILTSFHRHKEMYYNV